MDLRRIIRRLVTIQQDAETYIKIFKQRTKYKSQLPVPKVPFVSKRIKNQKKVNIKKLDF